jgi:glutamate 2,3-aminomutase
LLITSEALKTIPTGFNDGRRFWITRTKIKSYFKASDEDWENWHWQLKNRITEHRCFKRALAN